MSKPIKRGTVQLRMIQIVSMMLFGTILMSTMYARHPFRMPDPHATHVTIYARGYKPYTIWSNRLRLYPLFAFNISDLNKNLLPQGPISYRTAPSQSVTGKTLSNLTERVVQEVTHASTQVKNRHSTQDCIILRDRNFNYKTLHGLIIFKCKNYPFVIKLFMETPGSFFDFRSTGMEPPFFFYMGGGANRFLTGLTRIQNRNLVEHAISVNNRWKNHVELPRKWFWLPKQPHKLYLLGENIGGHKKIRTTLPSTYAIIEDEINTEHRITTLPMRKKLNVIIQLCNDLGLYIDPHTTNYTFIRDEVTKKCKIFILDTEHFPTMAGIQERVQFKNHLSWYAFLAKNYLKILYAQTKKDLIARQNETSEVSIFKPFI